MSHDAPDLAEILRTVREFIDDVTPRLEGMDRYHALCSQHLLDIALREIDTWVPQISPGDRILHDLIEAPADAPTNEVIANLCAAIRGGRFDDDLDSLRRALMIHVVEKVRVTKPQALSPIHLNSNDRNLDENRQ